MKPYLPIITSLFLVSTPFVPPKVASETEIIAQEINPYIKDNIAREITVKITSQSNGGSGVIIAQQDNNYLVLTNNHVLRDRDSFTISTHDGATHQATPIANGIQTDDDLALLQFSSDNSYQTATINSAATPREEQAILAVGYSTETGELITREGKIERVADKTLKDGYSIGYKSDIVQGMSGGAILNTDGEVIGINGKTAHPIVDTGYVYQDGTQLTSEEIEQYRQLSWGLTVNSLLVQINPEIVTAYGLPLPETTDEVEGTELTGWLGELEEKAKQITVRIDSSSGTNGSGVIVAQEGNTYTVLTADHVICEKDEANECIDYNYEIVTPDGNKYPIDTNTINREEGVDLATVRFSSEENYQVAQLADYPVADGDTVFVAGYPQLGQDSSPQWLFSLGLGLDREQGLLSIKDSSLSTDSNSLLSSQGSLSGGYEMVYTSPTYGGMSGGAVLDKDGSVIGIHGLAEGETAFETQSGSQKKIQLGYSLGIPIKTVMGLANRLKINSTLQVQDNRPQPLNSVEEIEAFTTAILGINPPQGNATADIWIERGNQLWRLTRYDEAVQAFDKAIELNPEYVHLAYYGKGLALQYNEAYEAASTSLQLATENQPNFEPAFRAKSEVLYYLNRLEEALVAIERAIALQPQNANLHGLRGLFLSDMKEYSEAEAAYTKAIKIVPRAAFFNNRGQFYFEQEKLDLALSDLDRAIKINSELAMAYNNRGNVYSKQERLDLALANYERTVEIDPEYAEAYYNRGRLYYIHRRKLDLALANYERAIEINPELAEVYNNRGLIYHERGQLDLALSDYKRAIEINPEYAQTYLNRGNFYAQQEQLDLALADYKRVIEINPEYAALAYANRGLIYYNQGKLDLALAEYNQAIKLDPKYASAYVNRGTIYYNQRKLDLALANFDRAIEIDPYDENTYYGQVFEMGSVRGNSYYNRGLVYYDQGKFDLALVDLHQVIEINPEYAKAYAILGLIYKEQGNTQAAVSNLQKAKQLFIAQGDTDREKFVSNALDALERDEVASGINLNEYANNETDIRLSRGVAYAEQEKLDLAINEFTQVIQLDHSNADAYNYRGLVYKSQGKLDLALADYNKAIKINPEYAEAYNNRGLVYKSRGKLDLALADFNRSIEIDAKSTDTYFNRGILYHEQEKFDLALNNYNRIIEINPEDADAYLNRGDIYHKQGKLNLALNNYNKVLEIDPEDAIAYFNRGNLYYEQRKLDSALRNYNQAIKINPEFAEAYGGLGFVYAEQGNTEVAILNFEKAKQLYIEQGDTEGEQTASEFLTKLKTVPNESTNNDAETHISRGNAHFKGGKLDLAIKEYTQAIQLDPNLALAYNNRGLIYDEQGKYDLALADYNQALEIDPNLALAYNNRGIVYYQQGKYDLALAEFNKALEINPEDDKSYYNRGLVYGSQGKYDLALSDFKKAIEINPELAEAYQYVGVVYTEQRNIEAANSNLERAKQLYIEQGNTEGEQGVLELLNRLQQY